MPAKKSNSKATATAEPEPTRPAGIPKLDSVTEPADTEPTDDLYDVEDDLITKPPVEDDTDDTATDTDDVDDELLELAEQLGVSETDARSFGAKNLERYLLALTEKTEPTVDTDDKTPEPPQPITVEAYKLKNEDLDEALAEQLAGMNSHFSEVAGKTVTTLRDEVRKDIEDLKAAVGQVVTQTNQIAQAAFEQRFDNWITTQEALKAELGTGSTADLDKDSTEYKNREKLYNRASRIATRFKDEHRPSEKKLLAMARDELFGKAKSTRQRLRSAVKNVPSVERPTNRAPKGKNRTDEAAAWLEERERQLGLDRLGPDGAGRTEYA